MENTFILERFLSNELDLSKKEIVLYLNLVKYGSRTILELAELSSLNRVTTHNNVENLTQRGLVTQVKKGRGSRRLIMAEPPEKLSVIFKERKARIEAAENQLDFITNELTSIKKEHRDNNDGMEIRRYEGKTEVGLIYNDIIKAKEIHSYANVKEIAVFFPGNMQKFIDAHKKNNEMYIWEIMEDSKNTRLYIKKMQSERFFCRLTNKHLNLAAIDYIMFDGKIAIIEASNGISGVVIENNNFYENAKAIHQFVWDSLPVVYE